VVKNTASSDVQKSLEDAFQIFHDFSQHLTESYRTLEQRIGKLNQELIDANNQRLEQLQEKERLASRLSNVLSALPAGVVVIDGRGVVAECNPVAVELLGEPLQGQLWRDVIQRAFTSSSQGSEVLLTSGRVVSIATGPLGTEPGQIFHLHDVTETRALLTALDRYKRLSAMGDMTARLAHQIRTPLSAALLYTSQLAKGNLDDVAQKKFANKAMNRLKHLEKVVEDMLAFTRGSGDNRKLMSLHELIDAFKRNAESRVESDEATLQIDNQADDCTLYVNVDAMLSVMQNLVDNAIQVIANDAQISVVIRSADQHSGMASIDFVFTDNGPGIPAENVNKIFEPYFTTRAQGTGLGLAIAQAVVQGHGGSMWLESTSAAGSTFIIRLPIHREQREAQSQAASK